MIIIYCFVATIMDYMSLFKLCQVVLHAIVFAKNIGDLLSNFIFDNIPSHVFGLKIAHVGNPGFLERIHSPISI